LGLKEEKRAHVVVYGISRFSKDGEGFFPTQEDEDVLQSFAQAVQREYLPYLFHNPAHSVDVMHGVARFLRMVASECSRSKLQQFALLVAAVGHVLGHPGMNNAFLLEVTHELALQSNDRSPLENMHGAKLYCFVGRPDTNVFANVSKVQYKEVRKDRHRCHSPHRL
jgi:hypothetical protein